jgi:hypothetical protein
MIEKPPYCRNCLCLTALRRKNFFGSFGSFKMFNFNSEYFYIFMLYKRCLGIFLKSCFCIKNYKMIEKPPYCRNCLCVTALRRKNFFGSFGSFKMFNFNSEYFYIFMLYKRCLGFFLKSCFCVKNYKMIEKHSYCRNCPYETALRRKNFWGSFGSFKKMFLCYKTLPVNLKYKAPRPSTINKAMRMRVIWEDSFSSLGDIWY